jgi:hypothetical protein
MALIAAANLFTIMGQPTISYTDAVVTTASAAAKNAVKNAANVTSATGVAPTAATHGAVVAAANAEFLSRAISNNNTREADYYAINYIGIAATFADGYAKGDTTLTYDKAMYTAHYDKLMDKYYYNSNPANMKAAFITAAGLIYQSISLKL